MTVYLWDLSNHDWARHAVNLADARKAGISGVTHKATEGNWYRDPYFDDFAHQLANVAFAVEGSYHVLNNGIDINAQTDYWIDHVSDTLDWRKRACWLWQIDAEPLDGYAAPTRAQILACGRRLEQRAKVPADRILVYGPNWVYGDRLAGIPYRLWASNYVNGSGGFRSLYPGDHAGHWDAYSGQTPLIVQFSSTATIGAQHTCDANAVRVADEAALQRLFLRSSTGTAPDASTSHPITGTTSNPLEAGSMFEIIYDTQTTVWYMWAPGYWHRFSSVDAITRAAQSALCVNGKYVLAELAKPAAKRTYPHIGLNNAHTVMTKNLALQG